MDDLIDIIFWLASLGLFALIYEGSFIRAVASLFVL